MRLNLTNFKTKDFTYGELILEFKPNNIYVISGENGSGKTTLLKEILFSKSNISFSNINDQELYMKKPYQLITYVSQNIYPSNLSVLEYITKFNKSINYYDIIEYFSLFNIDKNILKLKYKNISGGERQIIHLITGLLKDTKYLFLDEPTNNIDNNNLEILINILDKLKETKAIILVSHDDRIKKISTYNIILDTVNRKVIQENLSNNSNLLVLKNNNYKQVKATNYFIKLTLSKMFIATLGVIIFFISVVLGFSKFYLGNNLNQDLEEAQNYIISHPTGIMTDLSLDYARYKRISIDKNKLNKEISFNDINIVLSKNNVKQVYLNNTSHYNKIISELANDKYSLTPYSLPYKIINNLKNSTRNLIIPELLQGRYPQESKSEVVLSEQLLNDKFGITNNPIGQEIEIDYNYKKTKFKIVGLININMIFISENNDTLSGLYKYDKNTINSYLEKNFFKINDIPTEIIFEVSNTNQEEILTNYLIANYHANETKSNYLFQYLKLKDNKLVFLKLTLINSAIYILLSILFILLNAKTIRHTLLNLEDINNYFISKNKYKKLYILTQIGIIFTFYLLVFINTLYFRMQGKIYFILVNLIPSLISLGIYAISYIIFYYLNRKKIN